MKKLVLSLLLLVTATFMSGVFAQSAEEAAKYGQLQEIQLPKAGKLGKFIKKADPNVKALKISGELNGKDWELLYSLPNVAYLDLQDVHNTATSYKYKRADGQKMEYIITENELILFCTDALKYLAVPHNVVVVSLYGIVDYSLDMLVADYELVFAYTRTSDSQEIRRCKKMKFHEMKIISSTDGVAIETYFEKLGSENHTNVDCKTLYIEGDNKNIMC